MRKQYLRLSGLIVFVFAISTTGVQALTGQEIVNDLINNYVGKYPYVYGTHGPNSFDCSGLVYYVYNQHGINLPHTTKTDWTQYGAVITDTLQLQDGDVLLFGSSMSSLNHMGIYDSNGGYIIQALNSKRGIIREPTLSTWINSLSWNSYGSNQFQYAVRVIKDAGTHTAAVRKNGTIEVETEISGCIGSALCLRAVYSADGTLLGQSAADVDSGTGSITAYFPDYPNAAYVKVFLWNSLESMCPLTDSERVDL